MDRRNFIKCASAAVISLSLPKMAFANSSKVTVFYGGPILTMNPTNAMVTIQTAGYTIYIMLTSMFLRLAMLPVLQIYRNACVKKPK